MRRILIPIICLLVTITFLLLPSARTQEPEKPLPNTADYPQAGANCKRRVKVSPWVGTPGVDWPNTFQCFLAIHTCDGVKTSRSGVRSSAANMCADFWKVHNELANREICCDKCEPPKDEFQPDGGSDEFNPFDCKNLQNLEIKILSDQVTASACGRVLLRRHSESRAALEKTAQALREKAPVKICCDRLSPDEMAGQDEIGGSFLGFPDGEFVTDAYSDLDLYTNADKATVDGFPQGLRIPHVLPDVSCPGCKWELLKGELKCNSHGRNSGLFWYEATWRCPKTGVEVFKPSRQRVLQQPCRQR